jgi:2,3-bisphosphoglycerate-dependent phosphoglycerate mutase
VSAATLVLVRHGRTVWHAENRYAGRTEIDLDETGRRQAAALAAWAADDALAAIACSPQRRAKETAEPAARATGMQLAVDPRLREIDFGIAEGRTLAELDPSVVAAYLRDPVAHAMPGGEPPQAAAARACEALRELAARHPGERVLVVGHTTVFRLAICALLGIELRDYRRRLPALDNGAVTELILGGEGAALRRVNAAIGAAP